MLHNEDVIAWLNGNANELNKNDEDALFDKLYPDLKDNKNKYGFIGERLFKEWLSLNNITDVQKQYVVDSYRIDYKVANTFYEIKTRRYNMNGTAGEKITNVPHKYRNVLKKGEQMCIVLMAYQEQDCQGVFDTDDKNKAYIDLWKEQGFQFVKFTTMLRELATPNSPIKWSGGKRTLSKNICDIAKMLTGEKQVSTYVEPFLGGGTILIKMLHANFAQKYIVNDINPSIIHMFEDIKSNPKELIEQLQQYIVDGIDEKKYYELRDEYNAKKSTSLFMILNRTCYRGLYRVNKNGEFNVPYGNYKSISFDYDNIMRLSTLLNTHDIEFHIGSYDNIEYDDNCLVYLDPPYLNTFNAYDSSAFDHNAFAKFVDGLHCKFIVSNSTDFIDKLARTDIDSDVFEVSDRVNSKSPNTIRKEMVIWSFVE